MEIESLAQFDTYVAAHSGSLAGCRLQAVDLRDRGWELRAAEVSDTAFLGCLLSDSVAADLRQRGALVFPPSPHLPFDPYRIALYTADELYQDLASQPYEQTTDALAYRWDQEPRGREDVLALVLRSLHDDAISDALDEWAKGHRIVGVMGGHALERGTDGYAQAALLGRSLARNGFTVATGGGPGAMEAANLGAYLSPHPDGALTEALDLLAGVPSFQDVTAWARVAFTVRGRYPVGGAGASLSVPTWFYGHEPPNAFATSIAKYFSNALREDVLLAHSDSALVYLPGAAGTVQEVFQAATPAYYGGSRARRMILVGVAYWTKVIPAWPLLRRLAEGRPMEATLHLVDTVAEAGILLSRP
ncbi:LOG family protein [Actinospica robiniae]|uniref:LOG family protein n=1 Tax=Actinospica robiniae TaxID=304901 RepID=UPI001B7F80AE|nr:LOG family protein [Actinospica robiniae]